MSTRILHLTLHRRWFDAIASGVKREEYRDIKPYWNRRLECRTYDEIHFRNGYAKDAAFMRVECLGLRRGQFEGREVHALQLGQILELRNYTAPQPMLIPPTR
jgi:hypothetical protein